MKMKNSEFWIAVRRNERKQEEWYDLCSLSIKESVTRKNTQKTDYEWGIEFATNNPVVEIVRARIERIEP